MLLSQVIETFLTMKFHKFFMNKKKKKGCPSNILLLMPLKYQISNIKSVNVTRLGALHIGDYCLPLEESADAASQFLKIKLLNNLRTFLEIIFKHSCVQDSESLLWSGYKVSLLPICWHLSCLPDFFKGHWWWVLDHICRHLSFTSLGRGEEGGRQAMDVAEHCLCTGYAVYTHYFISGVIIMLLFTWGQICPQLLLL